MGGRLRPRARAGRQIRPGCSESRLTRTSGWSQFAGCGSVLHRSHHCVTQARSAWSERLSHLDSCQHTTSCVRRMISYNVSERYRARACLCVRVCLCVLVRACECVMHVRARTCACMRAHENHPGALLSPLRVHVRLPCSPAALSRFDGASSLILSS